MGKGRLEAFSDGVLAIIITILVLELKVPHEADLHALLRLWPVMLGYVLSFVYIGIYWNNHHHLFHAAKKVSGWVLWANLHLLFWLSLVPFVTGFIGEHHQASLPTALYGFVLIMAAVAYTILVRVIVAQEGKDSEVATAIGSDAKGWLSLAIYAVAIGLAFVRPWISQVLYASVAAVWFIPDRRIEKRHQSNP
ncbi:MAG: TMEM175 family protein [Polyangiales bacterium]